MSVAATILVIIAMQVLAIIVLIVENCLCVGSMVAFKTVMYMYLLLYLLTARKFADKLNMKFYIFNILSFVLWQIFGFVFFFLLASIAGLNSDSESSINAIDVIMWFNFIMYSLRVEVLNFIIFIINIINKKY